MVRARASYLLPALVMLIVSSVGFASSPAFADTFVPVSGAGSTWSSNALAQWAKNVNQYGMRINYAATGSSDGRNQFKNGTVDFAVSEIPYGLSDNGVVDVPPLRKYAYMPIVAGGTSFMYNLSVGNKQITELRLSGETLTKIFTGVVTNWADPVIKAENPGLVLPARKIVPVVRGDGSGTTAQFTAYMADQYGSLWKAYCAKVGRAASCGQTSIYPIVNGSGFTAQSGSLGVAGYVGQAQNVGTITYVEYSYALNANFPVVKLLNKAGYYTLPTAENVAVGLLGATINTNPRSPLYLTQQLGGVYNNRDPRAYAMSSYSYMVIPTAVEGTFSTDKGHTLGAFGYYFLCEGQRQVSQLGFSPLPINLVQAGLDQVRKIPGVQAQTIDIKKCNNPTFSSDGSNTLAKTAPQPLACDKAGPTQCGTSKAGVASNRGNGVGGKGGGSPGPGSGGAGGGPGGGGAGTPNPVTSAAPDGATTTPGDGGNGTTVDPDTGEIVTVSGTDSTGGADVASIPVTLPATSVGSTTLLLVLAAATLLTAVVLPPLLARRWKREAP